MAILESWIHDEMSEYMWVAGLTYSTMIRIGKVFAKEIHVHISAVFGPTSVTSAHAGVLPVP
jgi:hypothetical protein